MLTIPYYLYCSYSLQYLFENKIQYSMQSQQYLLPLLSGTRCTGHGESIYNIFVEVSRYH